MKWLIIMGAFGTFSAHADSPSPSEVIMGHWEKGRECVQSNRFEEAVEQYSHAIVLEEKYRGSRLYDIYNDRAKAHVLSGKYQEALSDFGMVLNRASLVHPLGPVNVIRALKGRAETYAAVSYHKEAAADVQSYEYLQSLIEKMDVLVKKSLLLSIRTVDNRIDGGEKGFTLAPVQKYGANKFDYDTNISQYASIALVKHSQESIDRERQGASDAWDRVNGHVYDMAREAMNLHAGDAAHHGIQAGSCAIEALEHTREARRMENENKNEESR